MNTSRAHAPLDITPEEMEVLRELLEAARDRLLVEIRHTDHRSFRDELNKRLERVESLLDRCSEG
ncbi:MAG TPA: hypothetical protein VGL72_00715 [Bryobacteraceae bacterium]|jgi:predicted metal-dependent TIM-barrel fold hydrolase